MMSSLLLTIDGRSAIQDSNMIYYSCRGFSLVIVWDIGCGGKIGGLPGRCEVSFPMPSIYTCIPSGRHSCILLIIPLISNANIYMDLVELLVSNLGDVVGISDQFSIHSDLLD